MPSSSSGWRQPRHGATGVGRHSRASHEAQPDLRCRAEGPMRSDAAGRSAAGSIQGSKIRRETPGRPAPAAVAKAGQIALDCARGRAAADNEIVIEEFTAIGAVPLEGEVERADFTGKARAAGCAFPLIRYIKPARPGLPGGLRRVPVYPQRVRTPRGQDPRALAMATTA